MEDLTKKIEQHHDFFSRIITFFGWGDTNHRRYFHEKMGECQ